MLKISLLRCAWSLVFVLLSTSSSVPAQTQNPSPCYHQELDNWAFLEGNWTVRTNTRLSASGPWEEAVASSQFTRDLNGCLLIERFTGIRRGQPFQSLSVFAWNDNSRKLQQVFSDSEHGPLIPYEGVKVGNEILVDLDWKLPDDRTVRLRRAYFDIAKDSFTVESRRSPDDGKTWDTTGRASYRRNPGATMANDTQQRFVYTLPETARVVVQKDLAYRQVQGKPLRFDFYRLPMTEKPGALPVAIVMNGFGDPRQKENFYQIEWAKLFAAVGLASVTFEPHREGVAEDFDALVAHLRANQDKLGVDASRVVAHASSGHASLGLPIFMDKRRTWLKGVVMNYSGGEVKELRADLPLLFVRVGLDQPFVNRSIDQLVARALAANLPVEVISYPGGHHPFEADDDNDFSRAVMERTLAFMHKAAAPGLHEALRASSDEAAAAAALTSEHWAAAVEGYEKLVAQRPKDFELQRRYGDALFGAKEYARALAAYEQSYTLGHWRKRDISYPAAVAAVRANDVAGALKWVERLVKTPFNRASLLTDPNFEPLRTNAQFRALAESK